MTPGPETYWRDDAPEPGRRLTSPSAERNAGPIHDVLARRLPSEGRVLEVASGTGQHAAWFARRFPSIFWQPSDPSATCRASIRSWCEGAPNVARPLALDMTDPAWPAAAGSGWDAVLAVNLVHVAPWEVCVGLLDGAARTIVPGGEIFLYGCFSRGGRHLSGSNAAFDAELRARDGRWGVRSVEETTQAAEHSGLTLLDVVAMPASNLLLVFGRA